MPSHENASNYFVIRDKRKATGWDNRKVITAKNALSGIAKRKQNAKRETQQAAYRIERSSIEWTSRQLEVIMILTKRGAAICPVMPIVRPEGRSDPRLQPGVYPAVTLTDVVQDGTT